ncbi:DUF5713 family protein [Proteus hauseri]|uniref:DUF5713 family protein n=1 Tax=Proteus hauseri TaxID=183417 RepID=UPI001009820C|nr:DUF5713 family protein [Proteus hauseri]QAV21867.1 hypothetical protein PH4a_00240 [Proteus hauseri]
MIIKNKVLAQYHFLSEMDNDKYYPIYLVKKGQEILKELCINIEGSQPKTLNELYALSHKATDKFNQLAEEFEKENSEIETVARECIAENIYIIAKEYGFEKADTEELIATRDW